MWSGETGYIFTIWSAAARLFDIRLTGSDNRFMFYIGGSLNAYSPAHAHHRFRHFGIDAKIYPSAGWIKVYLDGVEIFTFSGNTGNADITKVIWGNDTSSHYSSSIYLDDIYLDDTTVQAAPTRPLGRQFLIAANGNGASSDMTGSDGDQTDNYALVDDLPHNSDTDYVKANAAGPKRHLRPKHRHAASRHDLRRRRSLRRRPQAQRRRYPNPNRIVFRLCRTDRRMPTTRHHLHHLQRTARQLYPNTGLTWDQAGIDALEAGAQTAGTFTA